MCPRLSRELTGPRRNPGGQWNSLSSIFCGLVTCIRTLALLNSPKFFALLSILISLSEPSPGPGFLTDHKDSFVTWRTHIDVQFLFLWAQAVHCSQTQIPWSSVTDPKKSSSLFAIPTEGCALNHKAQSYHTFLLLRNVWQLINKSSTHLLSDHFLINPFTNSECSPNQDKTSQHASDITSSCLPLFRILSSSPPAKYPFIQSSLPWKTLTFCPSETQDLLELTIQKYSVWEKGSSYACNLLIPQHNDQTKMVTLYKNFRLDYTQTSLIPWSQWCPSF